MHVNIIEYYRNKTIEIINDSTYVLNSKDNLYNYMAKYCLDDYISSKHGIIIKNNEQILYSAILLGSG